MDTLLVERGFCADKATALRLVLSHKVKVGNEYATSPAQLVAPTDPITVKNIKRFVSRGGQKLQSALETFGFSPEGLRCADVGCSTGGFTDCLLQAGAKSVAAIDVGYGDLAWKLRQDSRVTVYERTNIRTVSPAEIAAPFDLVVADLSFIGLASLAKVFSALVESGGTFIGLIKPQFESHHNETDHRGFVYNNDVRVRTVNEVCSALEHVSFSVGDIMESPIKGKQSGNIEYLVIAYKQ